MLIRFREQPQNVIRCIYLDIMYTRDVRLKNINQAKTEFNMKYKPFNEQIRKQANRNIVANVLVYGSETWTPGKPKKIIAFKIWKIWYHCWMLKMI